MKLLYTLFAFIIYHLTFNISEASAQTAKVYRAGALLSTHSTLSAACSAANMIGDSILLSAHIFYEHDIPALGGQTWQGTYTPTDSTIIDAQSLGRVFKVSNVKKNRAINIRNIICTQGRASTAPELDGGGINRSVDSVVLKGYTIVRNCFASRSGGGAIGCMLADHAKLAYNHADSFGGGGSDLVLFDSAEVCNNDSRFGGGVASRLSILNNGTKIHHNTATVGGGGVYGMIYCGFPTSYQIIYNQAPMGAGVYGLLLPATSVLAVVLSNAYIYNPKPDGSRQNEVYVNGGVYLFDGCWFGKSDTIGLIKENSVPRKIDGKCAKANWSVNRGTALGKNDTLFPVGAAFTYSDGSPLPPNSCAWLVGNFSSTLGTMLTPNPKTSPTDTMSSLFRTYIYGKGESGTKSIDYLCWVDQDTFRSTQLVWGRDTSKLGIKSTAKESSVMIYPNPAKDVINIAGAESGSMITVYSSQGTVVRTQETVVSNQGTGNSGQVAVMDVSKLPAGHYILKIKNKDGEEGSAKIIVE